MKKVLYSLCGFILAWLLLHSFSFATIYLTEETKPMRIIDYIKQWGKDIIQTDLDTVDKFGPNETKFSISNTLDDVRENLAAYLQWVAWIGLVAAVILLIYNGIVLMTSPLSSDQTAEVKKRIRYILIGALAITWFYFVIRVLLSVLLQLLNN